MRTFRTLCFVTLACAALPLSACVSGGSSSGGSLSLEQQVQQHDVQLRQMQPSQADAWNQIQALRQELNTMKGQMDDPVSYTHLDVYKRQGAEWCESALNGVGNGNQEHDEQLF